MSDERKYIMRCDAAFYYVCEASSRGCYRDIATCKSEHDARLIISALNGVGK